MFGNKSNTSSNTFGRKSGKSNNSFGVKNNKIRNMVHHPIQDDTKPRVSDLEKYTPHP